MRYLLIAAAMCLLFACDVHEDKSDCGVETRLSFRFTRADGSNRFHSGEVPSLSVFVFDGNDLFVGRYDEWDNSLFNEHYTMTLPLMPGDYKFVVWGGLDDANYYLSTVGKGASNTLQPVVGKTRLGDLALRIKRETRNELSEQKHYVEVVPGTLLFGATQRETIEPNIAKDITIDLMKHTQRINLTVLGMPHAPTRALYDHMNIILEAPNGAYNFLGGMAADRSRLTWIQHDIADDGDITQTSTIYTLRTLFEDDHTLRINNLSTSTSFHTADLLRNYIRKLPAYGRQEDVDAEDEFDITLDLRAPLAITVTVNGWNVERPGEQIIQ